MNTSPAFITVAEAADMFDVHRSTIRRWIRLGLLQAKRSNRRAYAILYESAVRFMDSL